MGASNEQISCAMFRVSADKRSLSLLKALHRYPGLSLDGVILLDHFKIHAPAGKIN